MVSGKLPSIQSILWPRLRQFLRTPIETTDHRRAAKSREPVVFGSWCGDGPKDNRLMIEARVFLESFRRLIKEHDEL